MKVFAVLALTSVAMAADESHDAIARVKLSFNHPKTGMETEYELLWDKTIELSVGQSDNASYRLLVNPERDGTWKYSNSTQLMNWARASNVDEKTLNKAGQEYSSFQQCSSAQKLVDEDGNVLKLNSQRTKFTQPNDWRLRIDNGGRRVYYDLLVNEELHKPLNFAVKQHMFRPELPYGWEESVKDGAPIYRYYEVKDRGEWMPWVAGFPYSPTLNRIQRLLPGYEEADENGFYQYYETRDYYGSPVLDSLVPEKATKLRPNKTQETHVRPGVFNEDLAVTIRRVPPPPRAITRKPTGRRLNAIDRETPDSATAAHRRVLNRH